MSKRRFKTLADCRRYIGSLLNRIEAGDLDEALASKRAYITNILMGCIKDSDIEERIQKLEEGLKNELER